jgi:hypothetical protein
MHRTKRYGESGSPCLRPLVGVKGSVLLPFHIIVFADEVIPNMMSEIMLGGKLNKCFKNKEQIS